MIHKKTTIRKFLEILLIVLLVAYYYAPAFDFQEPVPEVEAAVAEGIIIAWPSTAASIPSGWSRVASLDGYYLEGGTILHRDRSLEKPETDNRSSPCPHDT